MFLLHVSLSLDTFYRGPLVMFWKAVAKHFQITIYVVKMRLCNLIGENIVGKNFKDKKFRHIANFY